MKEKIPSNKALLNFLKDPGSYPHAPEQVSHIQTHISHVFIAGLYVYKIKKPVNFDFLDYSTIEKRKYFCEREIDLNRRLCEDVYLEVVPISLGKKGFVFGDKDEYQVKEYAVKMKKLSEEHFLHTHIHDDSLDRQHLDRVAKKLSDFYRKQEPDEHILEFGQIKNIRYNTDENFHQTEQFIGQTIEKSAYNAINKFTDLYFQQQESLFQQRIDERRIVDGHGDLHLEHIHITPEKVRIYDCIEFNERFRYGDLASDLAYLAMDLDFNGCRKEERYFIEQMAERLNDSDLLRLIDFYKCYRAYVKGKVKSLQSSEEEVKGEDRRKSAETAVQYFNLSLRYALLGSKPVVLICMGQVGTGKSTLSKHLEKKLNIRRFSSDRLRKKAAGLPLFKRSPASQREELYSPEMSDKIYNELREKAEDQIRIGGSAILDATYNSHIRRKNLLKMLDDHNINYFFIEAHASDGVIRERLRNRDNESRIASDARVEDFKKLSRGYNPPREIDPHHLIRVDTTQTIPNTMEELYVKLIEKKLLPSG